jgi:hypothetical protein
LSERNGSEQYENFTKETNAISAKSPFGGRESSADSLVRTGYLGHGSRAVAAAALAWSAGARGKAAAEAAAWSVFRTGCPEQLVVAAVAYGGGCDGDVGRAGVESSRHVLRAVALA